MSLHRLPNRPPGYQSGSYMTRDERLIVEWAIWNVRACDLPRPIAAACTRLVGAGCYPRPATAGSYGPVVARVTAFPRDETAPLRDRLASRPHLAAAVDELARPDIDYILVHLERGTHGHA